MSTDAVTTHAALVTVLTTYAGMAGDDSIGQQWAASYDPAAQLAISTSSKLATSRGQTRDLIVIGAYNHQVAETAADHRDLPRPPAPLLSPDPCHPGDAPCAAGNGVPQPFGWSIIKDAVGWAWPNGHQDQLDAAKAAWHTAASDFRTIAQQVPNAVDLLNNQQSPEIEITVQTCNDRRTDFNSLADACQTLGDACGEYSTHLDDVHHKILDELKEFAIETAAAETAFAILAPFTGTISEWIGNSALAGRIAIRTRRIATIIAELATKTAKIITDTLKPLTERLKPLLDKVNKWVDAAKTRLSKHGGGVEPPRPRTGPAANAAEREQLIQELEGNGIKFDRENIVQIGRDPDGKIIFLEQGNGRAGLQHILSHADDFARKGISENELSEVVVRAATEGEKVGVSGRDRPIYQIMHLEPGGGVAALDDLNS
ncbi:hypothetical protein AB4305_34065 [Nocardia sp. 2YAB30]|uniref:WXG100-like domain-containing protein n=1 Tax=Nocardia sp. 2YAB30 TaxID=3233022 RepID=UPI003F958905